MIKIKFKKEGVVSRTDIILKPYIDKVLEGFTHTSVDKQLIPEIEHAIRNKITKSCKNMNDLKECYTNFARHIIDNLKDNNTICNTDLIDKINKKLVSPEELVELNPEEMYHERWKEIMDKKLLEIQKLNSDPEASTDLFTCPRCHRNKTSYFLRQDRSADEPMTVHITCCYCGHKWREC